MNTAAVASNNVIPFDINHSFAAPYWNINKLSSSMPLETIRYNHKNYSAYSLADCVQYYMLNNNALYAKHRA
jgi:hypothetical protein